MELHDWEQRSIDELERAYNRLSEPAKEAFHEVILEWRIHPGYVLVGVLVLGVLIGKFIL